MFRVGLEFERSFLILCHSERSEESRDSSLRSE